MKNFMLNSVLLLVALAGTMVALPVQKVMAHYVAAWKPSSPIELKAPWDPGQVRCARTYHEHAAPETWGGIDFYADLDGNEVCDNRDWDNTDNRVPGNWTVRAAHSGIAWYSPTPGDACSVANRGIYILDETRGIWTAYFHVYFPSGVKAGDTKPVSAGEIIGYTRYGANDPQKPHSRDCAKSNHLHFQVYVKGDPIPGAAPDSQDSRKWKLLDVRYLILDGKQLFTNFLGGNADCTDQPQSACWTTSLIGSHSTGFTRQGTGNGSSIASEQKTTVAYLGFRSGWRRIATAAKRADGKLMVQVWDIAGSTGDVSVKDTKTAGTIGSLALAASQDPLITENDYSIVVTAVKTESGDLKVIAWKVRADGIIERKGEASQSGEVSEISIVNVADPFASGVTSNTFRFVTASRTGGGTTGNLRLDVWDVDGANGTITLKGSKQENWTVANVAITTGGAGVVTATRTKVSGTYHLHIVPWKLEPTTSGLDIVFNKSTSIGHDLRDLNVAAFSPSLLVVAGIDVSGHMVLRSFSYSPNTDDIKFIDLHIDNHVFGPRARGVEVTEVVLNVQRGEFGGGLAITAARLKETLCCSGFSEIAYPDRGIAGNLKLHMWHVSADGYFSLGLDGIAGIGNPLNISMTAIGDSCVGSGCISTFVTVLRTGSGAIKVIVWEPKLQPSSSAPASALSLEQDNETDTSSNPTITSFKLTNNRKFIQFIAEGLRIDGINVEIYSLGGEKVYESDWSHGNQLRWNFLNNHQMRMANGVYLYVITVRKLDGSEDRTQVRKLVVLN